MLEKTYILTIKNSGQFSGTNIALDDTNHVVDIVGMLCECAANPLDFEVQTVCADLADLADGVTEGEQDKALAETYSNLKFD